MKALLLLPNLALLLSIATAQPDLHRSFRIEQPDRSFRGRIANPLRDSLVAYYGFEESTGTRYDGHGNNHLTAYNNPGDTAGIIGRAVRFDNTQNQYLQTSSPSMSVMNGSWSLMFWARPYLIDSYLKVCVTRGTGYSCNYLEYFMGFQSSSYSIRICNGSNNQATNPTTANVWRLHSITFDSQSDSVSVYEDAILKNKFYVPRPLTNIGVFTIGASGSAQYLFYGTVDELYFWRGLNIGVIFIQWYYNSGAGRTFPQTLDFQ